MYNADILALDITCLHVNRYVCFITDKKKTYKINIKRDVHTSFHYKPSNYSILIKN